MADGVEIALNVLGWIVAGLVTLAGVWLAHKVERTTVTRKEDLDRIYEPILKEFNAIIAGENSEMVRKMVGWSPSDEFKVIKHRGLLLPPRHNSLRNDISKIEELSENLLRLQDDLWKSVCLSVNTEHENANESLMESYGVPSIGAEGRSDNGRERLTGHQSSVLSTVAWQLMDDLNWSVFLNDRHHLESQLSDESRYSDCYKYGNRDEHAVTRRVLHDQSMAIFSSAANSTAGLRHQYLAAKGQFLEKAHEVHSKLESAAACGGRRY